MWELLDRARNGKKPIYIYEHFEDVVIKITPDLRFFVKFRSEKPFESHYRTSNMLYDILLEQNKVEITEEQYLNFALPTPAYLRYRNHPLNLTPPKKKGAKRKPTQPTVTISVINQKLCADADDKIKRAITTVLSNRRNRKFNLQLTEDGQGKFHLSKKTK